jgi:hypothetical protein
MLFFLVPNVHTVLDKFLVFCVTALSRVFAQCTTATKMREDTGRSDYSVMKYNNNWSIS